MVHAKSLTVFHPTAELLILQHGKEGPDVAKSLFEYLRENKILLRYFPNEASINMSIRLSIGTKAQMLKFVEVTNQWINL